MIYGFLGSIAWGENRRMAVQRMDDALGRLRVDGVSTTAPFHHGVMRHPEFRAGGVNTRWVEEVFIPAWMRA